MILDHRLSVKKTAPVAPNSHHESENPPPYVPDNDYGQHSRLPPPPLPKRPSMPSFPTPQRNSPSASTSKITRAVSDPPPTVNQVHLHSRKEDIIGTFYVDPSIPSLTPKRKKHGRRGTTTQPHASFQTRSGAISLSLATTGNVGNTKESQKAIVHVASHKGNIELRLLPTPPTRPRIGLDTNSKSGDVTLWLPETFSGVVQLNTRKGELHVLPALFRMAKILKETEKEAILLIGTQSADGDLLDLCQLSTRKGKVIVGLSGQDKHPEKTGFWQKLSQFLRGSP